MEENQHSMDQDKSKISRIEKNAISYYRRGSIQMQRIKKKNLYIKPNTRDIRQAFLSEIEDKSMG